MSLPINVFLLSGTSFPTLFCKIIFPLMTVTFNVSIFTLTFMAVYRWSVIINSLQPEMRHRHIFARIVGIWFIGFLLLLPLIIGQIEAATNLQCARQVRLGSETERKSSDKQNDGFDCSLICSVYSAHSLPINIRLWVQ